MVTVRAWITWGDMPPRDSSLNHTHQVPFACNPLSGSKDWNEDLFRGHHAAHHTPFHLGSQMSTEDLLGSPKMLMVTLASEEPPQSTTPGLALSAGCQVGSVRRVQHGRCQSDWSEWQGSPQHGPNLALREEAEAETSWCHTARTGQAGPWSPGAG